jgi:hypothetical protein
MSNVAELAQKAIHGAKNHTEDPLDKVLVSDVFVALHGFYGVLFISKFATGEMDSSGKDKGIVSAKRVWASELSKFDRDTVGAAIATCKTEHKQYPPSLPEFLDHCKARQIRQTYKPAVPEIAMSQGLKTEYARRAREVNAKHDQRAIDRKTGYVEVPTGLDGLKQCIAAAVGAAGGDECKELLRLDRLFAAKVPA